MDLAKLNEIAINAAYSAGKVIKESTSVSIPVNKKVGGASYASQVVTEVDRACEDAIFRYLLPTCEKYNLALLSEETADDGSRFEKDYFWCIDPLDGTLAFINQQPGFSVSIALVGKDGSPYLGVVYDPSTDSLYQATKDKGVYKNGKPWTGKQDNNYLTYVTDRKLADTPDRAVIATRLNQIVEKYNLQGIKEISGSGSVLNGIHVLENGPACMIKHPKKEAGGGSIWDFAATACIFQELELSATDFHGGKLDLNKKGGHFMNHQGVFYANISAM